MSENSARFPGVSSPRPVELLKLDEQPPQIFIGDAYAGVFDFDFETIAAVPGDAHGDTSFRRVYLMALER